MRANNIRLVYIPAGCTGELQPLDLTINKAYKAELKSAFITWYSDVITAGLREGKELTDITVDLRISVLKPIHAHWLMDVHAAISRRKDIIIDGFKKAGITNAI